MKQGDIVSIKLGDKKYIAGRVVYSIREHLSVETNEMGRILVERKLCTQIVFNPETCKFELFSKKS